MRYTTLHGYDIPELSLGTVALGLDYGVANSHGKPGREEAFAILRAATDAGINCFDTARTYGNAESLVGDFLRTTGSTKPVHVVTKFKLHAEDLADPKKAIAEAERSVRDSLVALKSKQIPICLLHMDRNLSRDVVAEVLPRILEHLKNAGLIHLGGVSVDHPAEAEIIGMHPLIDALQVPVNVLDQRLIGSGMIDALHAKGKIIFARSVFLQGLFFLASHQLRGNLVQAAPYLEALKRIAEREEMAVAELAFSYIHEMTGVTSVVFGADCVTQVCDNVARLQGKKVSDAGRRAISAALGTVPEEVITPGLWNHK